MRLTLWTLSLSLLLVSWNFEEVHGFEKGLHSQLKQKLQEPRQIIAGPGPGPGPGPAGPGLRRGPRIQTGRARSSLMGTPKKLGIDAPVVAVSRRQALITSSWLPVLLTAAASVGTTIPPAAAAENMPISIPIQAFWSSVDGLNSGETEDNKSAVQFDYSAYRAMKEDPTRTPSFKKAIINRLGINPGQPKVVLDLGTGPFALFAIMAAELGATKVYAIESDPSAAESARLVIQKAGWTDIITVLEGYSNEITLPEKADFCIAEIVGSIATEEGAYATIQDAHARFLKNPDSPSSWIPQRIQTYAAPASYSLHNLFGPPDFDWAKLKDPVRFNCRDPGLQLLANPVLVEDVEFYNVQKGATATPSQDLLTFVVDAQRIQDNKTPLYDEFRRGNSSPEDSARLADETSHSLSGIAFWPRLILGDNIVVDSRGYGDGKQQRSHWQTVLPIMAGRPIGGLQGGEKISVKVDFNVPSVVAKPCQYSLVGKVEFPGSATDSTGST
eukprot:CAMPEP_0119023212 /NCGR_PEP_ID=MMETSP1176-20130426/29544_1 /TAXON_ID=265551 /ORGANISM="Synedropsis recta cf, Strain CCMP1620" /LENGTH=499 /DNA_ID=CAMNT_0006978247 /DNA_START=39 /DNA_END=1538 /DNA_ORIENTATION=-